MNAKASDCLLGRTLSRLHFAATPVDRNAHAVGELQGSADSTERRLGLCMRNRRYKAQLPLGPGSEYDLPV